MSADRPIRGFYKDESGSSAMEFAILGPTFLMLFFGTLGLGWAIHNIATVNFVAERAGRVLQLNSSMTESDMSKEVKSQLANLIQDDVALDFEIGTGVSGYRIGRATVTYQYEFQIPFVGTYPLSYSSTVSVPLL